MKHKSTKKYAGFLSHKQSKSRIRYLRKKGYDIMIVGKRVYKRLKKI